MDMVELMKMAGTLREKMAEVQDQAQALRVTGEAGGGMVKVTMNGERHVLKVEIDPALWAQTGDRALAEDLARAAFNAACGLVGSQLRAPPLEDLSRQLGIDPAMMAR